MSNKPRSPRKRTVWRVLADPLGYEMAFVEVWREAEAAAFLDARTLEGNGRAGVEVNRCVLKAKVSRLDLLNRVDFLDESEVVPAEKWRVAPRKETA